MATIKQVLEAGFGDKRILVVGDLVADQFLRGTIGRVSREAPVFILQHENTETVGGGAANAAVNVASLGAVSEVVGLIGTDPNGDALVDALARSGVKTDRVVRSEILKTTTKLRVLAGHHYARRQQVIRIDYENEDGKSAEHSEEITRAAIGALEAADVLIVSDYGYGAASPEIAREIIKVASARGIPVLVDSRNALGGFDGATAATPNQEEVERLLEGDFEASACEALRRKLGLEALLVTLGNKGMCLLNDGREPVQIGIIGKDEPVDVTGAGDTVIAAFALGVASGLGWETAARMANHAGGIVVMKNGTDSVSHAELFESIEKFEPSLLDA